MDFFHFIFCNVEGLVIGIDAIESVHSITEIDEFFNHSFARGGSNYDLVPTVEALVRLYKNEFTIFDSGHQAIAQNSQAISIRIITMYVKESLALARWRLNCVEETFTA